MKEYLRHDVQNFISVSAFYSVYHFELSGLDVGEAESHDFTEILYIANGTHTLYLDDVMHSLVEGQMIIYAPRAVHYWTEEMLNDSHVYVVSFGADADAISSIYNKVITLTASQRSQLEKILAIGTEIFIPLPRQEGRSEMAIREGTKPSELQVLRNLLENFLIDVYNNETNAAALAGISERQIINLMYVVEQHMRNCITSDICLTEISAEYKVSISTLKHLFKARYNCSPKAYFINLKIEEAKRLISDTSLSFTEISSHLNFSSVHYFSRLFKEKIGLTPSEYAKSTRGK